MLAPVSDAARIPFAMLVVFGAAKILAELFERLGQPGLLGEILAGVLIGPAVLGWIAPNDILDALSVLGAMFLLFRVGLEVRSSDLLRVGGTAMAVATLGVLLPFFAGFGALLLWGRSQVEGMFVGAAMVATSVGVTAEVLSANGWLEERASKIILAAAVIDDVLGLVVLAVVSSIAKGHLDLLQLAATGFLAFAFVFIVVKWGAPSMARLLPGLGEWLRVSEGQFAFSLILMFALSLAAVYAGVAAIIGAFLAGLAVAESVTPRVRDLTHGVAELLIPFFLAGIGLRVDLGVFSRGPILSLAVVLALLAILSKLIGCGAGAIRLGKRDALRIGIGMAPRGEVGMVVAQFGLSLGVIERDIYSVVVAMAVASTLIPLPFLKLAYGKIQNADATR